MLITFKYIYFIFCVFFIIMKSSSTYHKESFRHYGILAHSFKCPCCVLIEKKPAPSDPEINLKFSQCLILSSSEIHKALTS